MARRTFDGAFESWDFILFHGRTFRIVRTPREELRVPEEMWYFSKKWHIHTKYSKYQHEHRFTFSILHIWGFGTYWRWNKHYNTISWPIPADFKIWNFLTKNFFLEIWIFWWNSKFCPEVLEMFHMMQKTSKGPKVLIFKYMMTSN